MYKLLCLVLVSALSLAAAQIPSVPNPVALPAPEDDVQSELVLSFIEDNPGVNNDEGPYRKTPFVEVIHEPALQECLDVGMDQAECPEFEWSLPFIPSDLTYEAEEVVAFEWFRLEMRTKHRINLEIGAGLPVINCVLGGIDLLWLIFDGNLFFPPEEFCDGKGVQIIPNCFVACDLNILQSICPRAKGDCAPLHRQGHPRGDEARARHLLPRVSTSGVGASGFTPCRARRLALGH